MPDDHVTVKGAGRDAIPQNGRNSPETQRGILNRLLFRWGGTLLLHARGFKMQQEAPHGPGLSDSLHTLIHCIHLAM